MMDKQEAIDFVLDELDKGRGLPEITAALSRQLGAPPDLVGKFVAQTAQRYQQSKAALGQPPAAVQKPPSPSQVPPVFGAPPPATGQPPAASQPPLATSYEPFDPDRRVVGSNPQPASVAAMVEPLPKPDAYEPPPVVAEAPAPPERDAVVSPELEKFILDELGKNKRQGDVVLGVVERTGMEYRQAQRLVSRVGAKNYKKVTARQNCLIIPLAVIALVAGLVLLGASVFEAYAIRVLLPSPNNLSIEQVQAAVQRGRELPWAFITGLALSVGGGIGLISAVRKQME
jgi:hypothetical protein